MPAFVCSASLVTKSALVGASTKSRRRRKAKARMALPYSDCLNTLRWTSATDQIPDERPEFWVGHAVRREEEVRQVREAKYQVRSPLYHFAAAGDRVMRHLTQKAEGHGCMEQADAIRVIKGQSETEGSMPVIQPIRRRLIVVGCATAVLGVRAVSAQAASLPRGAEVREIVPGLVLTPTPLTIHINVENDTWSGTDRYYTNGLRLYAERRQWAPGWRRLLPKRLSICSEAAVLLPGCSQLSTGVYFGQSMYTPRVISETIPSRGDRPYAGLLYAGARARVASERWSQTVELNLGMTGKPSLAGATQRGWHALINAQRPNGWEYQVPFRATFSASYESAWRFDRVSVDSLDNPAGWRRWAGFMPYAGAVAGNIFSHVRGGTTARLGFNLPSDWGPEFIAPSDAPGVDGTPPPKKREAPWFAVYLFAGTDGRAVLRNAFVQELRAQTGISKETFVADFSYGLAVRVRRIGLSGRKVARSAEFAPDGRTQRFTSFSVSYFPTSR